MIKLLKKAKIQVDTHALHLATYYYSYHTFSYKSWLSHGVKINFYQKYLFHPTVPFFFLIKVKLASTKHCWQIRSLRIMYMPDNF